LPLDIFLPVRHHAAPMSASEKRFSLSRAASMKRRRVKNQIPLRPHAPGGLHKG